jgi:serine O-acetyltransferase
MTRNVQSPLALFETDVQAWRDNGWSSLGRSKTGRLLMLVHYGGLRATLIHRVAHATQRRGVPVLPSLLSQLNVALHGIELSPTIPIGPGLYMPHTVGTVINAFSIGANATLQGGITVGQKDNTGFPTLEDGVVLAAGCRVLGAITIGANSTVGANAVVLQDVPRGAVMVGVPARQLGATSP